MRREIVLIAGWGQSEHACQPLVEALSDLGKVSLIRIEGTLESLHAQLDLQASRLSSNCQVLMLGWSLGGLVLLNWLDRRQADINSPGLCISLLACNPCFIASEGWPGVDSAVFQAFQSRLQVSPKATVLRFQALQTQGGEGAASDLRWLREDPELTTLTTPSKVTALYNTLEWLMTLDQRSTLAQWPRLLRRPLVLLGAQDALVPSRVMESLSSWADTDIVPSMAHYPGMAARDALVQSVRAWWAA